MNLKLFNTLWISVFLSFIALLGMNAPIAVSNLRGFKPILREQKSMDLKYFSFISNPSARNIKKYYIQAALHGNEKLTTEFVYWLTQRLANGSSKLIALGGTPSTSIQIDLVPIANPSGYQKGSRYNNNHVNLNRNFPIYWGLTQENPGKYSFSEPETQAIADLFSKSVYNAAIDIHGYTNMIVTPSAYSTSPQHKAWLNAVASETQKKLPGYTVTNGKELGDGGAFEDWAFWQKNIPSICLELRTSNRYLVDSESKNSGPNVDSFMIYEDYLLSIFTQADKLKVSYQDNYFVGAPATKSRAPRLTLKKKSEANTLNDTIH